MLDAVSIFKRIEVTDVILQNAAQSPANTIPQRRRKSLKAIIGLI